MSREDGFLTVQYLVAIGLSLVLFTALANVVVFQYGRGIVRSTLDEAVRAGARVTSSPQAATAACQEVADRATADLLGGAMGEQLTMRCEPQPDRMTAVSEVDFRSWLPGFPDWEFVEEASAVQETLPAPVTAP